MAARKDVNYLTCVDVAEGEMMSTTSSRRQFIKTIGIAAAGSSAITTALVHPTSKASAQEEGDVIVIGVFGGGLSNDPAKTTAVEDWAKMENTFNGLVRYKKGSFEIEPDLATGWEISDDGLEYIFHLNQGVQFHNGYGELTAKDVKFSLERQLDPELAALTVSNLEDLDHVEVVDDHTIKMVLSRPSTPFISKIANARGAAGAIISSRAADELGNYNYTEHPIGTGPFIYQSEIPNQSVTYVRNDDYFEGPAKPSGMIIQAMADETTRALAIEASEVHLGSFSGGDVIEQYEDGSKTQFLVGEQAQLMGIFLNSLVKPFDDPKVRRALAYAVDSEEIVLGAKLGYAIQASPGLLHPDMFGFDDSLTPITHDPERAQFELSELGLEDLTLEIVGTPGSNTATIAALLQQQFAQAGVNFNLQQLERGALSARRAAEDNPGTLVSFGRTPEPDSILSIFTESQIPPGGNNYNRYTGIDDLMSQQREQQSEDERAETLKKIQQKLAKDMPMIPIWYDQMVVLAANELEGYIHDPLGGFWVHGLSLDSQS